MVIDIVNAASASCMSSESSFTVSNTAHAMPRLYNAYISASAYIFKDCAMSWAGVWSEACKAIVKHLQPPHPSSIHHLYSLELAIKWNLLVTLLFLHKPPSEGPSSAASINPKPMYKRGDLSGLIRDYERDVVLGGNVPRGVSKSEEDEDFKKLRSASELLSHSQFSRAW